MTFIFRVFALLLFLFFDSKGQAAVPGNFKTEATLLVSESSARPGDTVTAALQLRMQPGWHTYWRNPSSGGPGIETSIKWELPKGITAGALQWPVPGKFTVSSYVSYVYEKEVLLIVPLTIGPDAPRGNVTLRGKVEWLECDDKECVPGKATVQAMLTIGEETKLSSSAPLIQKWQQLLPGQNPSLAGRAYWEGPGNEENRPLIIEFQPLEEAPKPDFYPYESENFSIGVKSEVLSADKNYVRLRKLVEKPEGAWPTNVMGLIIHNTEAEPHSGIEATFAIEPGTASGGGTGGSSLKGIASETKQSLGLVLVLAFLGGLILNIMPCVLPVIALKIFGFVNQSKEAPARVRQLGLIYGLGVWVSFLLLAALVIVVKGGGGSAAWGMQFQNPQFLVGITILVTLVALNLFGVFEVTLAGGALGKASELAGREGKSGAFFNGVLTTVLATPCTAPFLGTAIVYAILQPAAIILLVFSLAAFGLAIPYIILSWNPALLKYLPKPGSWMEKFKMAMGFPMLATAVWLFSIAAAHFGKPGPKWLGLVLVLVALSAWIWGEFVQTGSRRKGLAVGFAIASLLLAYFYILEGKLEWRAPVFASGMEGQIGHKKDGIAWEKWSLDAIAKAQAAGHPVLVDFTADWCLNCQLNEARALEIPSVRAKIKDTGTVPLVADFTRKSPEIAAELERHGRSAIPLVLVYPGVPNAPPEILPVWLTEKIMLEALDRAAAKKK